MTLSLDSLVSHLGTLLDSPDLHLNQHRLCRFTLDDKLELSIEECNPPDSAQCYATIAQLPPFGRERFYASILEAQLFGAELGDGMRFGLDSAEGEILIEKRIALEGLDAEAFTSSVEDFVNWALFWMDKLVALEPQESGLGGNVPILDPPRFDDFARYNFIRA